MQLHRIDTRHRHAAAIDASAQPGPSWLCHPALTGMQYTAAMMLPIIQG
jgi:hypothetical protein